MTSFLKTARLGLISAIAEEQQGLISELSHVKVETRGQREYVSGLLWGLESVCVLSRMGKVAAATTATTLIEHFGVTHLLFTGVAGAAGSDIKVGDIVIADQLIQHDMNCFPLFPRFEIPLTGRSLFDTDPQMTEKLKLAASGFFLHDLDEVIDKDDRESFRLTQPVLHNGLIASGDEFITCSDRMSKLKNDLPQVLAVEMEGAAVAQVCHEYGIPFALMRTISDGANEDAPVDFMNFIERVAAAYAFHIVRRWCQA